MAGENSIELKQLETKIKIRDEANKIQIYTIGKENNKPTKFLLFIGQTGAGKTTLLNAVFNQLLQVQYDDDFRYIIKDEVGNVKKSSTVSQTEFVTGYLLYNQPGMASDCNFLIIDTPGLGDTRGKEEQTKIRNQMEVFLREEKFEVSELHCLGFVVNGTINRSHEYLREIIKEFESLFGKDTIDITKILATHADDTPPVSKVLREMDIKADKLYNFDNGVLFTKNKGSSTKSRLEKMKWEILTGQYEEFFEDMIAAKPTSLRLTKEGILEKMNLERSLMMLKTHIDEKVNVLLECRSKRKLYESYMNCMVSNAAFEGVETYTEKRRETINGRFTHAHNCPSCNQTCVYPCYTINIVLLICPMFGDCEFCHCSNMSHVREGERIVSTVKTRNVTHADMKRRFEEAKRQKESTEDVIKKLENKIAQQSADIAVYIRKTVDHIKRINEITRHPRRKTAQEYIKQIIAEIEDTMAVKNKNPEDKKFIAETLKAIPNQLCNA